MTLKSLDIHLTNKCHFKCRHCLYDSGMHNVDKNELSFPEWRKIFTDFATLSDGKGSINLLGGEPLIHKNFIELAKESIKLGLKTNLISNFGFAEDMIKDVGRVNFHRISFGVHGGEKNHDWLRNSKGDYSKTICAIELFLKNKNKPLINITTVLHKNNLKDVVSVLELSNKLGVDSQSFFFFTPVGRGMDFPDLMANPSDWARAREKVLRWLSKNSPPFSVKWEKAYLPRTSSGKFQGGLCAGISTSSLEIRSNGNVYYCGVLSAVDGPCLGNLKKDNLSDVYKSLSSKRIKGVSGCTALAILSQKKNNNLADPRKNTSKWIPSCPYELESLYSPEPSKK